MRIEMKSQKKMAQKKVVDIGPTSSLVEKGKESVKG